MVTALDTRREVPQGSRVQIVLERDARGLVRARIPDTFRGIRGRIGAAPHPRLRHYIIHTRAADRGANRWGYDQLSLESSLAATDDDRAVQRATMLNALAPVTLPSSGRTIWSTAQIAAGTTETDGHVAATLWHERGVEIRHDLISQSVEWAPRTPAADRVAALDALIASTASDSPDRQALIAERARLDREKYEAWDFPSSTYHIGREGTEAPPLAFGTFDMGFESLRAFQSWRSWDRVNFKVTEGAFFETPEATIPRATVALGESSAYDHFAAPVFWRYLVEWQAVYVIGTIWFYSIVALPQTGVFMDALPVLPVPYRLAGADQFSANSQAISRHVEWTNTYTRMLAADRAYEVFSPFFFIILIGRVAGRVTLSTIDQPAGRLCGVVKARPGGGPELTRYVWGRTVDERPFEVVDELSLDTADVIGDSTITVG